MRSDWRKSGGNRVGGGAGGGGGGGGETALPPLTERGKPLARGDVQKCWGGPRGAGWGAGQVCGPSPLGPLPPGSGQDPGRWGRVALGSGRLEASVSLSAKWAGGGQGHWGCGEPEGGAQGKAGSLHRPLQAKLASRHWVCPKPEPRIPAWGDGERVEGFALSPQEVVRCPRGEGSWRYNRGETEAQGLAPLYPGLSPA